MTVLAIIPARYGSTRFPGKPLALLGGRPVVQWVYESVRRFTPYVVVATDDESIITEVEAFGGRAVMTSTQHPSGTSRLCEAYSRLAMPCDVVLNVQGDEPFIDMEHLQALTDCLDNNPQADVATLVSEFDPSEPIERLTDPNRIKVVTDSHDQAVYFSRSVVPYVRDCPLSQWPSRVRYLIHIGVYAYRSPVLGLITDMPPSPLALAENLEQLTWLQSGLRIATCCVSAPTVGIDTPADLDRANAILSKR